ncbi:NUDIX hydrolase [Lipingzhangella sp. LS1_29]|uniref:NUDIX hydrolase n=1 Tax=Lipingzhangella rawalii TaxID=2055835 RepID=A0ABU2HAC3_9ACTN|nr:NUDIX hydrolase [Lipingzhangella rawalii]MDS1271549.1 NUDIX hydrolase [Lipingzhangella rawalii]
MPKMCDQRTVGVLVTNERGQTLLIRRGTAPSGFAPVAGHADLDTAGDHSALATLADVATAEVSEEVGLDVTTLSATSVTERWIPTWCRRTRPAGVTESGHFWTVYTATATGSLRPDPRETQGAGWYTKAEMQRLAARTAAFAIGRLSVREWEQHPGLEPVWCLLGCELRIVTLAPRFHSAIRNLAQMAT